MAIEGHDMACVLLGGEDGRLVRWRALTPPDSTSKHVVAIATSHRFESRLSICLLLETCCTSLEGAADFRISG